VPDVGVLVGDKHLKITGAVATVALVLAAAPPAGAALGGATPFDARNGPDLRSATVVQDARDSGATTLVAFCFDRRLQTGGLTPEALRLVGYDPADTVAAVAADVDQGRADADLERCVVAEFAGRPDLARYTVATAEANVVHAASGGLQGNLADSTGLVTSRERGLTLRPDLVAARADIGRNELLYVFDQPLDAADLGPGGLQFGFYDDEGARRDGEAARFDDSDRRVRVRFPAVAQSPGITVADAERVFTRSADAPDTRFASVALTREDELGETDGQVASRPDLVSATAVAPQIVRFRFDADCILAGAAVRPERFVLRDVLGRQVRGGHAIVLQGPDTPGDGRVVEVTFETAADPGVAPGAVQAGVVEDAVGCNGAPGGAGSTYGTVALNDGAGPLAELTGFTDAPDGQGAVFTQSPAKLTITFDQDVAAVGDLARFRLLGENGNLLLPSAPSDLVHVGQRRVELQLANGQLNGIAGVQLLPGAVLGAHGSANPVQIVKVRTTKAPDGNQQAGPVAAPPAPPPPAAGSPPARFDDPTGAGPAAPAAAAPTPQPAQVIIAPGASAARKARIVFARFRGSTLVVRLRGSQPRVRLRIALHGRDGRRLRTLVRTVPTGKRITVRRLVARRAVRSLRLTVL